MADHETLLGSSAVYLFGRRLIDLALKQRYDKAIGLANGANNHLRAQLTDPQARFARIFAFSFEGEFFVLPRPTIFLVHGSGLDPNDPPPTGAGGSAVVEYQRLARSPGNSSRTGVGFFSGAFAKDTRVWIYDKGDHSLRLEPQSGSFEQILLDQELGDDYGGIGGFGRSSGGRSSGGRSSGGRSSGGRSSGVMGRSSG